MSKYDYSIANTTREQRKKYALEGELCKLGGGEPSLFARDLVNQYIDGTMEIADVKKAIIARYANA